MARVAGSVAALLALGAAGQAAAQTLPCPGPTLASTAPPPAEMPWLDATLPPERRAEVLLAEMTLEEKIDMATGELCLVYGYYNAPIERLGIPALTMADGPAGIRVTYERVNGGRATLLPAPIALAASWDPALASIQGDVLGAEAFALGHNILLGPTLDLARTPLAGRNFEGFGEDPLLAARLAVPLVRAIQEHPVLADAKHYAVYNQETERFEVDARLDERALRELHLRPFEAAVREGDVATVMCGFNRVNGVFACENRLLLSDILKGEMGFRGFVLSDWGAIRTTAGAALAGLDQEQAFERFFGRRLADAVRRGEVPEAAVHDKARRILETMFRFGLFDRRTEPFAGLPVEEHGARSREIAERGVVLLRNEGLLPLSEAAIRTIAVIGADAANVVTQGGGAARVEPTYGVSVLDGIRARAGPGVRVEHAAGGDPVSAPHLLPGPPIVPSSVLTLRAPHSATRGVRVEYWSTPGFAGPPEISRVERHVARSLGFFNYPSVNASSLPQIPNRFSLRRVSARFTGTLTPPATGEYTLTLSSRGRGWLWLDGALVIDHAEVHDLEPRSATVHLVAGQRYDLRVEYAADHPDVGVKKDLGGDVKLGWLVPPGAVTPDVEEAAALAARSDVAVVVVRDYGTEGRDRVDLALPNAQDALVHAVAAANPRTVVVLMTGQPVTMPWLDEVQAVIEAWYPGQEQGNVVARVLFGDVNPSGKLPVTFPRALEETPAGALAPDGPADAAGPATTYSEGILVGYRWYDSLAAEPLFPFGHGLSYTSFRYDDLGADSGVRPHPARAGATPTAPEAWGEVAFTVTNTGARAGAEVAQVYVGPCAGDTGRPPRALAGFAKVELQPGASERVVVEVAPESLSTWAAGRGWVSTECERPVYVGSSSRDIRLDGVIRPPSADPTALPALPPRPHPARLPR